MGLGSGKRGAGEILFTSMTHDGVKRRIRERRSGYLGRYVAYPGYRLRWSGKMEHFRDTFSNGKADAALAASVFHFGEIRIGDLKQYLKDAGINVRI